MGSAAMLELEVQWRRHDASCTSWAVRTSCLLLAGFHWRQCQDCDHSECQSLGGVCPGDSEYFELCEYSSQAGKQGVCSFSVANIVLAGTNTTLPPAVNWHTYLHCCSSSIVANLLLCQ